MHIKKPKARIAVGADGSGTTFQRIIHACQKGEIHAEVAIVFTNREGVGALRLAVYHRIPSITLTGNATLRTRQLMHTLTEAHAPIDLVCLAGYLKMFPKELVQAFRGRAINSHPALDMDRFGGEGFFGTRVTKAELNAGVQKTGSTIHFVSERYDEGEVIRQSSVEVRPDDTPESLLARKLSVERELYIEVIRELLKSGS